MVSCEEHRLSLTFPHLKGKGNHSGLGGRIKFAECGRAASTGLGLLDGPSPPPYS